MAMSNYARFYIALNRLPEDDREELKEEIVRQFSSGRTGSLRELRWQEYNAACEALEKMAGIKEQQEAGREAVRMLRSSVLHQMQLLGVDTADWQRVDGFCLDKRIAGKEFRKLDGQELEALEVKLRIIRRKKNRENNLLN